MRLIDKTNNRRWNYYKSRNQTFWSNKVRQDLRKEESKGYRYFPDPDLPPLMLSIKKIKQLEEILPELPDDKKRFVNDYKIKDYDSEIIVNDQHVSDFWEEEKLVNNRDSKMVVSWITGELFSYLKKIDKNLSESIYWKVWRIIRSDFWWDYFK